MGRNRDRLFYVQGYCELENGVVHFIGGMRGVSTLQAWYHIIYALRKPYNIDYWIDPVMERCESLPSSKNYLRHGICKKLHCRFEPYTDGRVRRFRKFSEKEKENFNNVNGDRLPTFELVESLPEFDINELYETNKSTQRMNFIQTNSVPAELELVNTIEYNLNWLKQSVVHYSSDIMGFDRERFKNEVYSAMRRLEELEKYLDEKTSSKKADSREYYQRIEESSLATLNTIKSYTCRKLDKWILEDITEVEQFLQAKHSYYKQQSIDCLVAWF